MCRKEGRKERINIHIVYAEEQAEECATAQAGGQSQHAHSFLPFVVDSLGESGFINFQQHGLENYWSTGRAT